MHANAEFAVQTSDHDPDIVRLTISKAGDVDGDGDIDRNDIPCDHGRTQHQPERSLRSARLNGDGRIDLTDVRLATTGMHASGCAVQ